MPKTKLRHMPPAPRLTKPWACSCGEWKSDWLPAIAKHRCVCAVGRAAPWPGPGKAPPSERESDPGPADGLPCPKCGRRFGTFNQLRGHLGRCSYVETPAGSPRPSAPSPTHDPVEAAGSAKAVAAVRRACDQEEKHALEAAARAQAAADAIGAATRASPEAWAASGGAKGHSVAECDPVSHPRHYTSHPSGIECIQVTEHMSFNVGNAVKHLWRADLKGNALEDLRKAAWYVAREIERRVSAGRALEPVTAGGAR